MNETDTQEIYTEAHNRLVRRVNTLEALLDQHERYLSKCGGYPVGGEPERFTPDGMNAREIGYDPEEPIPDPETETKRMIGVLSQAFGWRVRPPDERGDRVWNWGGEEGFPDEVWVYRKRDGYLVRGHVEGSEIPQITVMPGFMNRLPPLRPLRRVMEDSSEPETAQCPSPEETIPDADKEGPAQDATAAMRHAISQALGFRVREPDFVCQARSLILWDWHNHGEDTVAFQAYREHLGPSYILSPPNGEWSIRCAPKHIPHHLVAKLRSILAADPAPLDNAETPEGQSWTDPRVTPDAEPDDLVERTRSKLKRWQVTEDKYHDANHVELSLIALLREWLDRANLRPTREEAIANYEFWKRNCYKAYDSQQESMALAEGKQADLNNLLVDYSRTQLREVTLRHEIAELRATIADAALEDEEGEISNPGPRVVWSEVMKPHDGFRLIATDSRASFGVIFEIGKRYRVTVTEADDTLEEGRNG